MVRSGLKRLFILTLLLGLFLAPCAAQNLASYHNIILDVGTGEGILATITVYDANTTDKATLYYANGAALSNPLTTDSEGRFSFFLTPGAYDIKVSGYRITTYTLEDVLILGLEERTYCDTSATFAAALTAIGAAETTLIVTSQEAVTADATVPATLALSFERGGSLNISAGKTVTINGSLDAGRYRIFEGAGSVVLGDDAARIIYSEWSGGTDAPLLNDDLSTDRWLEQDSNTFIGVGVVGAGNLEHTVGDSGWYNAAFGYQSLYSNTTGYPNAAFGYQSLYSNTTGNFNSAFGHKSLYANTIGSRNSAFGQLSLSSNTIGTYNSAFGWEALMLNTEGNDNSAFGRVALRANTIGDNNSGFGHGTLFKNTEGVSNSAVGYASLHDNEIGNYNVAFGHAALYSNTGSNNSAIGYLALQNNTSGESNIALGESAGRYQSDGVSGLVTPENSIYIGVDSKAGSDPAGGEDAITNEIVIGYDAAGHGANTITIGNTSTTKNYIRGDFFTDGWLEQTSNTFIGVNVAGAGNLAHGAGSEGWYNSFFGEYAGNSITTGYFNVFLGRQTGFATTTGKWNTFVGGYAGRSNIDGGYNSMLGYQAGRFQNDGTSALETPEASIYIGAQTKSGSVPAGGEDVIANEIVIGYDAVGHGSDTVTLGNSSITDTILRGQVSMSGVSVQKFVVTTDNTNGVDTYSVAEMLGGLIRRGTGDELTAARTDVTDTAANIVAAITGCVVGSGFEFSIANEDSTHTVALDGGVGVTIIPTDPSTPIPVNSTGRFLVVVTNIGEGTEAVSVHALGYSTH